MKAFSMLCASGRGDAGVDYVTRLRGYTTDGEARVEWLRAWVGWAGLQGCSWGEDSGKQWSETSQRTRERGPGGFLGQRVLDLRAEALALKLRNLS